MHVHGYNRKDATIGYSTLSLINLLTSNIHVLPLAPRRVNNCPHSKECCSFRIIHFVNQFLVHSEHSVVHVPALIPTCARLVHKTNVMKGYSYGLSPRLAETFISVTARIQYLS